MQDTVNARTLRRSVLRATGVAAGASLGLVGAGRAAAQETVEFDGPITITGEDSGKTFVQAGDFDADGGVAVAIDPGVTSVVLDGAGHTIRNGRIAGGAYLEASMENLVIRNVHLDGGSIGLESVAGSEVTDNVVDGVSLHEGNRLRVMRNTVEGSIESHENAFGNELSQNVARGLRMQGDIGDNRIANNVILGGGGPGIDVAPTSDDGGHRVVENYVGKNEGAGVSLEGVGGSAIRRNTVVGNGSDGLRLLFTSDLRIEENTLVGNGGSGIDEWQSANEYWENVAVSNARHGYVGDDVQSDVRRNFAVENGADGFRVTGSGFFLKRNGAVANGGVGFHLGAATARSDAAHRGKVKFNQSNRNGTHGVVLDSTTKTVVRLNTVTANRADGIALVDADGNGLTRNTVCANDGEQLVIDDQSEDNKFANNVIC